MALQIATVTNSLAAITITGISTKDIDQIPASGSARQSLLIPRAGDFMTNVRVIRDSYGGGSTAKMTVTYNLAYRLLYKPLGSGAANYLTIFPDLIEGIGLILDAILAIDTIQGAVDIEPTEVFGVGAVEDPAGQLFWGCDLTLQVTEFVN